MPSGHTLLSPSLESGVGMNVMHDGNHGSPTGWGTNLWRNHYIGNGYYQQVQHNVLHHTYTNISLDMMKIYAGES
jgi:hypothetical protein